MNSVLPTAVCGGPLAIRTEGLVKKYGRDLALEDVDLRVPEGAVYILAGPNGAGKTTLIEALQGTVRADAGTAEVFGVEVCRHGPQVRAQIGYVSARADWGHLWMSVGRMMGHHAAFYPAWDHDYAARLARTFSLPLERKFGTLSRGFARRLQLVLALAHRPPLLLLDEPTDGLDRVVRDELSGILAEHIADSPTTVLVSTHLIYEFDAFADHLGVLRDGRLVAQVSRDRLYRMLRRYRAEVPAGWTPTRLLQEGVVHRAGADRVVQWVVWGEEAEVVAQFACSGAVVRETRPLTFDDAVLALLRLEHGIPLP